MLRIVKHELIADLMTAVESAAYFFAHIIGDKLYAVQGWLSKYVEAYALKLWVYAQNPNPDYCHIAEQV